MCYFSVKEHNFDHRVYENVLAIYVRNDLDFMI